MNNSETEEELSEWVVIQTSSSSSIDSSTPPNSPLLQPSHLPENPSNDEDEDSVVSVVGKEEEEEQGESSSTANLSLPWRVIETAKKRLTDSGLFVWTVESTTRRRVFWSFTLVGGLFLVSSLVYVKVMIWWRRRLQEEKLRFLALLVREKDQKIKQLMLEIGRLNELLSSRRRVQVVRIV